MTMVYGEISKYQGRCTKIKQKRTQVLEVF